MADENKIPQEENAYQPDLMTLQDEDGNEITFEVIDALDHKGVHYLAVVEYVEDEEDLDEDAQLVILSVGRDAEGEYLDVVDDDETLMEVGALFEKRLSDNFSCPARFVAEYMILLIIHREPGVRWGIADRPVRVHPGGSMREHETIGRAPTCP